MKLRDELKLLQKRVDEIESIISERRGVVPPGWECQQARDYRRIVAERRAAREGR